MYVMHANDFTIFMDILYYLLYFIFISCSVQTPSSLQQGDSSFEKRTAVLSCLERQWHPISLCLMRTQWVLSQHMSARAQKSVTRKKRLNTAQTSHILHANAAGHCVLFIPLDP